MLSDKRPVRDFLQLLTEKEVDQAIICPGSRNAPFSISLYNHSKIKAHSVADERSAGFIALGMSQQLRKPVVVICTSGTATLNLAPAIAEAFYQHVPLLIVTADRPMEWIDQGEGQSIRQQNVFANFVKGSYQIADEEAHPDLAWYNTRMMDEAIRLCTEGVHGPVHINFPLREKLYGTTEVTDIEVKKIQKAKTELHLQSDLCEELSTQISKAGKVLILAGQLLPDEALKQELKKWATLPQVCVLTEAHSNLADTNFITTIDRLVMQWNENEQAYILPDILITIGHNIISRKIKEYLRKGKMEHWHIDLSGEGLDTFKNLTRIFPLTPVSFFSSLAPKAHAKASYRDTLLRINEQRGQAAQEFIQQQPFSDLKAFQIIYSQIPGQQDLQMGNSSVVRYILLNDAREDLHHFGNRGVAGIDGCTSTAVGAAFASGRLTTLISGDIAFFYDSNAFWNTLVTDHLKIIVINNGGGGIFRIIEGPKSTPALEKFFETKHSRSAQSLAAMYAIPYYSASDEASLMTGLEKLYSEKSYCILEVHTSHSPNDEVLKNYFNHLANNTKS